MLEKTHKIQELDKALGLNYRKQFEIAQTLNDAAVLADYHNWQKIRLNSQGYSQKAINDYFDKLRQLLKAGKLKSQARKIDELFNQSMLYSSVEDTINTPQKRVLEKIEVLYIQFLFNQKIHKASELIAKSLKNGIDVRDIYLHVFQPALYQIGYLWQINQINIAQEHYFTAATQTIMLQLYPYVIKKKTKDRRVVAAGTSQNMHDIGIRMVADFFEMDGWASFFLGANNPTSAILDAIHYFSPHVLALSVSVSEQLKTAQETIKRIRSEPANKDVKIILGGRPINQSPDLYRKMNADGFGRDAQEAVQIANRLTGS